MTRKNDGCKLMKVGLKHHVTEKYRNLNATSIQGCHGNRSTQMPMLF